MCNPVMYRLLFFSLPMNIHAINFNSPGEVLSLERRWEFVHEGKISKQTRERGSQAVLTWTLCTAWLHELRLWMSQDEEKHECEHQGLLEDLRYITQGRQEGQREVVWQRDGADTVADSPSQ